MEGYVVTIIRVEPERVARHLIERLRQAIRGIKILAEYPASRDDGTANWDLIVAVDIQLETIYNDLTISDLDSAVTMVRKVLEHAIGPFEHQAGSAVRATNLCQSSSFP